MLLFFISIQQIFIHHPVLQPGIAIMLCMCALSATITIIFSSVSAHNQLQPTSAEGGEDCGNSAVIAVSAVSLLLIVTLITVIFTQCLLILRMRRSIKNTPTECTNPTMHIPVSPNKAYAVHTITEDTSYELVM